MDWQEFQRFTTDVLAEEAGIATSSEYATPGPKTDRGADVIAHLSDSDNIDIGSCKRYQKTTATKIKQWSDEFLAHWDDHWNHQNIRRFVLATTATNLIEREIRDQIAEETRRFKSEYGISYELWGPIDFRKKLRNHRVIASRYLTEAWADAICGRVSDGPITTKAVTDVLNAGVIGQLSDLQQKLSGQVAKRADAAVDALRTGDTEPARTLVRELRSDKEWAQLLPEARARIIRVEGTLALLDDKLEDAKRLASELSGLPQPEERRLEAQIAFRQGNTKEAIEILGTPTTLAGKQLLASIYLDDGQLENGEALVDALLQVATIDAETLRLRALAHLLKGNREAALTTIEEAEVQSGHWIAIIIAGAIIRYAQAISPLARREWYMAPNPVDLSLVKFDTQSQHALQQATTLFERWSKLDGRSLDGKHWKLAALCNLANHHDDASELATQLLKEDPADVTAIAWIVMRGLDCDLGASFDTLKSEYLQGTDVFKVRALALMIASHPDFEREAQILKDGLDAQSGEARGEAERWRQRLGQDDGDRSTPDDDFEVGDVIKHARATDDWQSLRPVLADHFSCERPEPGALMLAQFAAEHQQWRILVDYVDPILEFETAQAIRLAAFVCANNDMPDRALSIIDTHESAFGEVIPPDMHRLRAKLQLELGQLKKALQNADLIGSPANEIPDQLIGAQIKAQAGDLRGAAETVAEAYRQNALTPLEALQWSQALELHDPKFAKELFRYGVRDGVEGSHAVAAMHQAFRLGLDNMVAQFLPQVNEQAKADDPSIKLASIDDLVEMIKQNSESQREIEELYLKGALPGHVFVRGKAGSFAHIYLAGLEYDPAPLAAKLIRHGSRPRDINYGDDWPHWRIHLDITGLLEAYNADLLDILASHSTPILISPRLPELLQRMEHEAVHSQPARLDTLAKTVAVIDAGEISIATAIGEVDQSIIFGGDDPEKDDEWSALLHYVVENGFATESDIAGIAGNRAPATAFDLKKGSAVYANFAALEQLQRLNALQFLADQYRISTDLTDVDQARLEIKAAKIGGETATKLAEIREFVASGLRRNKLETVPQTELNDGEPRDILIESLADILMAPEVDGGVVWIDDRTVNSHPRANEMPIISVLDVLSALERSGSLSHDDKLDKIAKLQGKGAVFLPFSSDDVIPSLQKAPIISQEVIEDEHLRIVRRHFAATCRVLPHAKIGEKDERVAGRPDEIEIARTYLGAAPGSLAQIWGDEAADISRCYAAADWIWFNLSLGEVTHPQNWETIEQGQNFFEAMEVGQCLIRATEIGWVGPSQLAEKREHYLNWLWHRAIEPKIRIDDQFVERIVDHLEKFFGGLIREYRKQFRGRDLDLLEAELGRRIGFLPDPIKQIIARRPTFSRYYRVRPAVTIGKHHFEPAIFWKAARAALIYGKARVRTNNGNIARMARAQDGLILRKPIRAKLTDELLTVLAARGEDVPKAFDAFAEKLELPEAAEKQYRSRALDACEPHKMAEALHEAIEASQTHRYQKTEEKLNTNKSVGLAEFVPTSLETLQHYLGISPGCENFDVGEAFNRLAMRVGEAEALRRLAGIPIKLAGYVKPKQDDISKLAVEQLAPIPLVQMMALRRSDGGEIDTNAEIELLIASLDRCGGCFLAILKWVWRWSFRDADWRKLGASKRAILVWAHANQLAEMLIRTGSDLKRVERYFSENQLEVQPNDFFVSNRYLPVDLASPRWITDAVLLFHSLAAIFGEENVSEQISEELGDTVRDRLTMRSDEFASPTVELMMRMGAYTENDLGDFLGSVPHGVLPENLDPATMLDSVIDGALDHLETAPTSADGWMQLVAFCPSGLSDVQWEKAKALIAKVGLWNLPFLVEKIQFTVWRALLSPLLVRDWEEATKELTGLARHGRERFGGRINPQGDETANQAYAAICELVETAALIAGGGGVETFDERFERAVRSIVTVWPESASVIRPMINELVSRTMTRRAASLNELRNLLKTFP